MADDPNTTPTTTPATPPEPVQQTNPPQTPPPVPAPAPVPPKVREQAGYFARHPEEFEAVLTEMEQAGHVQVRQEINTLKREITVRDAISEHGLTKADAAFISGNNEAEINASAAALKARIGNGAANTEVPAETAATNTEPATPAPEPVPALPDNRGGRSSIEQAEADFIEEFNKTDMSEFIR